MKFYDVLAVLIPFQRNISQKEKLHAKDHAPANVIGLGNVHEGTSPFAKIEAYLEQKEKETRKLFLLNQFFILHDFL